MASDLNDTLVSVPGKASHGGNPPMDRRRAFALTMRNIWPILELRALYFLLTGATIVMSFPLFWMISSSLKTLQETNSPGIILVPAHPTLAAYLSVFQNTNFLRAYFNTVFYTTLALAGTVISIAAVAYAF